MNIEIRGTSTSEFKVVVGIVLVIIVGTFACLAAGVFGDGKEASDRAMEIVKWIVGTSGLLGGSYAVSRGIAKSGPAKALLPLLLLAGVASSGCGMDAAQRRAWVQVGTQAACAAGRLACEQYGGDQCTALVKMGCAITPDVIKVLVAKQVPPTAGEVNHTVARAYSASPLRATMAPKAKPGFAVPAGGARDSRPLEIR